MLIATPLSLISGNCPGKLCGYKGAGKRPPLAVTETLVWVGRAAGRQAGNQWKREVILNVHQGLCFSPVA